MTELIDGLGRGAVVPGKGRAFGRDELDAARLGAGRRLTALGTLTLPGA